MRKIAFLFSLVLAAAGASGRSAASDMLKVAVVSRGLWEPSVNELGVRDGYFKREGLDVELFYTQSTGEHLQALMSGSVDVAVGMGMLSVLGANAKGAPIDVIASTSTGSTDLFLYVRQDSPIKTLNDAAGKTIAVTGAGSSSHLAVLALLDHYKISAKPVVSGSLPAILANVMSGQIDVGVSSAPFNLNAVEAGSIRVIGRASEVPALRAQTTRVIAVLGPTFEARRDVLVRYIRGYDEAREAMYEDAAAREWFGALQGLSLDQITQDLPIYLPRESTQTADLKGLELSIAQAKEFKFVPPAYDSQRIASHLRMLSGQ